MSIIRLFLLFLVFTSINLMTISLGLAATVQPDSIVSIFEHNSCQGAENSSALLIPGYGVTTEFMAYLGSQLDGQNGRACFAHVYAVNYTNNGEGNYGYGGLRDQDTTIENAGAPIVGWSADVGEAINWLNTQGFDKPLLIPWSSGEPAALTWLYDEVYLKELTPEEVPIKAITIFAGVPTIDINWLGREGMWPVALTALQPLVYDNSGACLIKFPPSVWSLFLYSSTRAQLFKNDMSDSLGFLRQTVSSPEGVVFDMAGLVRDDFDRGELVPNGECKKKKFIYTEEVGESVVSYVVSLPDTLFSATGVPVLFMWGERDIIITQSTTTSQYNHYCLKKGDYKCAIESVPNSPHGGLVSAEWTTETGETVASVISQKVNSFILSTSKTFAKRK